MLGTVVTWIYPVTLLSLPVNMRVAIITLLFGAALADTSSYVTLKHTNGNTVCFPPLPP